MNRRVVLVVLVANLVALLVLTLAYPQLMVGPGPLLPSHAGLEHRCFACHQPGRGPVTDRCITCHAVADIGIRSATGAPLAGRPRRIAFHRELSDPDCMACHRAHETVTSVRGAPGAFRHESLRSAMRDQCQDCHRKPQDGLHAGIVANCGSCHGTSSWKPASFDHERQFALEGCLLYTSDAADE